jgi:hypothetical protein
MRPHQREAADEHQCGEAVLYPRRAAAYNSDDYETAEKYFAIADRAGKLDQAAQQLRAELPGQKKAWTDEQAVRKQEAAADDLPRVKLETSKGTIVIELFENEAPQAVANFVSLVEKKYYDGLMPVSRLDSWLRGRSDRQWVRRPRFNPLRMQQDNAASICGTLRGPRRRDTGGLQFFLLLAHDPPHRRHTALAASPASGRSRQVMPRSSSARPRPTNREGRCHSQHMYEPVKLQGQSSRPVHSALPMLGTALEIEYRALSTYVEKILATRSSVRYTVGDFGWFFREL